MFLTVCDCTSQTNSPPTVEAGVRVLSEMIGTVFRRISAFFPILTFSGRRVHTSCRHLLSCVVICRFVGSPPGLGLEHLIVGSKQKLTITFISFNKYRSNTFTMAK